MDNTTLSQFNNLRILGINLMALNEILKFLDCVGTCRLKKLIL
jgi:hypothetical protein